MSFRWGAGEDTTIESGQITAARQEGLRRSLGGKTTIGGQTSKQEVMLEFKSEIWHGAH